MSPLKALVSLFPGGAGLAQRFSHARRTRKLAKIGDNEARFTHIYSNNKWNNPESRSGVGSTAKHTQHIRRELPKLFEQLNVRTVMDAPCGDYNWFKLVERNGIEYVGGDIVGPLIEDNQREFGDEVTHFTQLDITKDQLPEADLWLCRDCLMHLSNQDIFAAIDNFCRSSIPYLLTTTHSDNHENIDIPSGHFRLLNLELAPFSFPKPLLSIDDCVEGLPTRHLALWNRSQLLELTG